MKKLFSKPSVILSAFFITTSLAYGEVNTAELSEKISTLTVGMDTLWVMIAAFLVFFMNLGFAMVEAGLARAKNTVNILAKNFVVFAIASIVFYIIGFGLMFGDGNGFIGTKGLYFVNGVVDDYSSLSWTNVPLWAKFFFQLAFAGTAATIVSGAVAERIKFLSFVWSLFKISANGKRIGEVADKLD